MSDEGNTMAPFTPTTEQVWAWIEQDTLPGDRAEVRAQFDRWLASRDAEIEAELDADWRSASGIQHWKVEWPDGSSWSGQSQDRAYERLDEEPGGTLYRLDRRTWIKVE